MDREIRIDYEGVPITKRKEKFPSSKGDVEINAVIWEPDVANGAPEPRAILQIVHGMVEFIDRYDDLARMLVANGFIVGGHDHIGHGESVNSTDDWGRMPLDGGDRILIEDTGLMRHLLQEIYGMGLPYFILGHSMGSFVVRAYIAEHGEGLAGAIIEGTGNISTALSSLGKRLAGITGRMRGENHVSSMIEGMALGSYAKAIEGARTPVDWISRDEAVVDRYLAEPRNSFKFSVGGYHALMSLTEITAKPATVAMVPRPLPIFIASGDQDPVGEGGKGPRALYELFRKAGSEDVELKLYEGARHELHNELNKIEFMSDVVAWLNAHMPGVPDAEREEPASEDEQSAGEGDRPVEA